jgi:hypothetical protein
MLNANLRNIKEEYTIQEIHYSTKLHLLLKVLSMIYGYLNQ